VTSTHTTEPVLKKVLVLFAHPVFQTSLLNKSLLDGLPDSAQITVHDLYECYPNFMIDVEREQALLDSHEVIIFQHPLYWYSSPAILKEWMDLVLEHGYAYGTDATALRGKQFISVITSGGDVSNYQGDRNIRELLKPFELTAKLCNMTFLPPFITYAGLKIKAMNFDQQLPANYLSQQVNKYQELIDDLIHGRIDPLLCVHYATMNEHFEQLTGEHD
jgi:glutathione-regulated potassium-efflux system ancillary protein KefG